MGKDAGQESDQHTQAIMLRVSIFWPTTNITRKTMVVVYRDEADGFIITAFMTSRADKVARGRRRIWQRES